MHIFSSTDAKKKAIIATIIIVFILVISAVLLFPFIEAFSHPVQVKAFILQFGMWAPLALIALQILQMIFLLIPSMPILIAGGYIFGAWGILYSAIGILIGSIIVFEIARIFGRPFLESIVDRHLIEKLDYQSENISKTLFVLFLIPPLPHDVFSYVAGITNIDIKKYALIVFVGRLPEIVFFTLVGYQLTKLNLFWSLLLIGIIIVGSIIIFYYKDLIETHIHKYMGRLNK
ncbi:MAG: VTT domain-containing protein [archaeon]|jgi:uncharacterized membrane protein YdjX (TVP38/TMEM64 family)